MFPSRIAGIPCQIEVHHFFEQPPMGPRADSDMDCYGYVQFDFTVHDRKGYRAKWLEAKLTPDDEERILQEFLRERDA